MRDHHMNPVEAVQALIDCGAEIALAHHYGTFQLTDEAIDAPLLALAEALNKTGIPLERFATLRPVKCGNSKLTGLLSFTASPGRASYLYTL
jgi:L-ascorbate metabolism protein UlaG (beta-lactamase superfamily)